MLLKLTLLWEDKIDQANKRKRAKYAELTTMCLKNGWKANCESVDINCRAFAGHPLHHVFNTLGVRVRVRTTIYNLQ